MPRLPRLLAAPAIVTALVLASIFATPALAAANVSFSADSTSSAHWGPHHSAILLTVGDGPGAYAMASLHGFPSAIPTQAPTFTTDAYNAGSPRWVMTFSGGGYAFGYPAQFGDFWEIDSDGVYTDWAVVQAYFAGQTVTSVYLIADSDQAPGTTDSITAVQYDGTFYTRS